jgi:hypothetical protein
MKKIVVFRLLILMLLTGCNSHASSPSVFSPVGQFYLNLTSPTQEQGRIIELQKSWGYETENSYTEMTNIVEGWIPSPNLEEAPYSLS